MGTPKARMLLFLVSLLWHSCSGDFELNTAVMPTWEATLNQIMATKRFPVGVNQMRFSLGKTRSDYDKIMKALALFKEHSIHMVFGPYDDAIALATESLHIPYMSTTDVMSPYLNSTFQIPPNLDDFSEAMLDMVKHYGWEKVSIFIDDDKGISIVERLLTNHELMIKSWKLDYDANERQIRDHLVNMRTVFMQKSIVFCRKKNVKKLLETARNLAMLSTPYQWFFYDPGDQMPDIFGSFPDVMVNFTVFGLMPYNSAQPILRIGETGFNLSMANDSLSIMSTAMSLLEENRTTEEIRKNLTDIISNIQQTGMTGHLQFDEEGKRTNFTILLTEISGETANLIGTWQASKNIFERGLSLFPRTGLSNRTAPFPLRGRVAKVVTILEKPFAMFRRDYTVRLGNERYEGFAIDLIKEVADMLQFDYEIYLVHDGKFGSKSPSGEWDGMIGELLSGNATMSVAPLSINSQREEAVDFTKPFMTRYISVLMKVPKSETSYFEFLNPLHPIVWFCTFGAFVFVSIVLYILERVGNVNKKEYPSISFRESFWFVFGSLLQGSTDNSPSTLPGRILTSSWWFFALILISSYTANLAAFLTVKKINTPIKSVTDLASQTKIKYGTVKSSGIMSFFKNTNIEHFSKMWAQMSEIDPSSMVVSTEEGFKKVKEGNFAFFWDTTVNKYKTIEDCDFMEVGPPFDPKGFGIGVPPGATYREDLSMAILRLSDTGKLHELENKWWGRRDCPDLSKPSTDETSELQIENVAGVFFILLGGVALAAIVCLGEYFAKQITRSVRKEMPSGVTVNGLRNIYRRNKEDRA